MLNQMLKKGADANCTSDETSSLCEAAYNGNHECVDILLKAGAYVNSSYWDNGTPLINAAYSGNVRCVELLLQAGAGAGVNKQCNRGMTALMCGARNGYVRCVELLLQAGADVNKQCNLDRTALIYAVIESNEKCMKTLLNAGAHVNMRSIDYHYFPFRSKKHFVSETIATTATVTGCW